MYYLHYNKQTGLIIGAPYHSAVHGKEVPLYNTEPITTQDAEGNKITQEIGTVQTGTSLDLSAIPTPYITLTTAEHADWFNNQDRRKVDVEKLKLIEYEPPGPTLEVLKIFKWTEIKNERDRRERFPLDYLEKQFDFDDISSQRLQWAIDAARSALFLGGTFVITWTCYDNTTIDLIAEQVIGIPIAVAQRTDNLHQAARALREQIETAETVEELEAITWPE